MDHQLATVRRVTAYAFLLGAATVVWLLLAGGRAEAAAEGPDRPRALGENAAAVVEHGVRPAVDAVAETAREAAPAPARRVVAPAVEEGRDTAVRVADTATDAVDQADAALPATPVDAAVQAAGGAAVAITGDVVEPAVEQARDTVRDTVSAVADGLPRPEPLAPTAPAADPAPVPTDATAPGETQGRDGGEARGDARGATQHSRETDRGGAPAGLPLAADPLLAPDRAAAPGAADRAVPAESEPLPNAVSAPAPTLAGSSAAGSSGADVPAGLPTVAPQLGSRTTSPTSGDDDAARPGPALLPGSTPD